MHILVCQDILLQFYCLAKLKNSFGILKELESHHLQYSYPFFLKKIKQKLYIYIHIICIYLQVNWPWPHETVCLEKKNKAPTSLRFLDYWFGPSEVQVKTELLQWNSFYGIERFGITIQFPIQSHFVHPNIPRLGIGLLNTPSRDLDSLIANNPLTLNLYKSCDTGSTRLDKSA